MTALALTISQTGKAVTPAGQAREDLSLGTNVTVTASGGVGPYTLSVADSPPNTAMTSDTVSVVSNVSPSIVVLPENAGTYRIGVVDSSGATDGSQLAFITFYAGPALSADPTKLPRRIPAFDETTEHNVPDTIDPTGNVKGWKREWDRWFLVIQALYAEVMGGGSTVTDWKAADITAMQALPDAIPGDTCYVENSFKIWLMVPPATYPTGGNVVTGVNGQWFLAVSVLCGTTQLIPNGTTSEVTIPVANLPAGSVPVITRDTRSVTSNSIGDLSVTALNTSGFTVSSTDKDDNSVFNWVLPVPSPGTSFNLSSSFAGSTGATGAAGATGSKGSTGATGASTTGATGAAGSAGATGSGGATGQTGLAGPTGAAGSNGTNGAVGATGSAGATGQTGAPGATGTAGTNGTNGLPGATGATGPATDLTDVINAINNIASPNPFVVNNDGFFLVNGSGQYMNRSA